MPFRDSPGYFFSISIRRYPGLDQLISTWKREDGTRVLAYVTAHLNVLGDVYSNNSDTGFWITQQDNGQTYVQNYGQFDVRAFCSTGWMTNSISIRIFKKSLQELKSGLISIWFLILKKVATADILNPDPNCNCLNPARIFYKELLKQNLMDLGIAGWMADFGEYLPIDSRTIFPHKWWSNQDHGEVRKIFPTK